MAKLLNIQTGQVTIGSASITVSATPSSYTVAQSILMWSYSGGSTVSTRQAVRGRKVNSTTFTWDRNESTGDIVIEWQLMEFDTNVSVEDISITWGSTDLSKTAAISSVTLARSFILAGGMQAVTGTDMGNDDYLRWQFNSSTEAQINRESHNDAAHIVEAQVIDYIGCSTQELTHTITSSTAASTTDTISSVTVGDTFVCGSNDVNLTQPGNDDVLWRLDLQNSTTLRLLREGTASITINWRNFIVEFTDGTSLQQGLHTLAALDSTDDITLTALTVAESSAALGSGSCFQMSHGSNADTNDDTREGFMRSLLASSTILRVTREQNPTVIQLAFQALEWNVGGIILQAMHHRKQIGVS